MNKAIVIGLLVTILLFAIWWFFLKKKSRYTPQQTWTVYGTDECGWTRKQLKEMDDKGVVYTYVNCRDGDCGEIKSYPTLKSGDGEVKVGFTTF